MKRLKEWLDAAGISEGAIFRQVAGLDPAILAAHSLRSGFLTSGAASSASIFKLLEVSRHRRFRCTAFLIVCCRPKSRQIASPGGSRCSLSGDKDRICSFPIMAG